MKKNKFVDVVKWFKRISLILGWLGDSIARFPNFKDEEESDDNDTEDIVEDEV